jgi:probable F420-dependent oxidoreductase
VTESISFAIQVAPDADDSVSVAQQVEASGFDALCVGDHPGLTISPLVALAAAAPLTDTIRLGTAVLNAGVRHPFDIAADAATLDMVSGGRVLLGLGAGHSAQEWEMLGRPYPSPAARIDRLAVILPLVRDLLAGETVTHHGTDFTLERAHLEIVPRRPVPILVGGNSRALVRLGAVQADVVEIGGLGRTLPDGHFHEIRWRVPQIDQVISAFYEAIGMRQPQLGALVQIVSITESAESKAAAFLDAAAERLPPETLPGVDELLAAPFTLIGTKNEIVQKIRDAHARWGISRYTVRAPALKEVTDLIGALRS